MIAVHIDIIHGDHFVRMPEPRPVDPGILFIPLHGAAAYRNAVLSCALPNKNESLLLQSESGAAFEKCPARAQAVARVQNPVFHGPTIARLM